MLNSRLSTHFILIGSVMISGCSNQNSSVKPPQNAQANPLKLGSLASCKTYSGLPDEWLKNETSGMVKLAAGEFNLGSNQGYPDEINFGQKTRKVNAFWIDQTEVTVAQFQSFVDATHYITDAEKQNQAAVFEPDLQNPKQWWNLKSGYNWKFPNGKNGKRPSPNEPVRYVTKNDAEHYAIWLDRDLPTEIEWEYAAKAGDSNDTPLYQHPADHAQKPTANYWQGEFPFENLKQDQFEGVAPVGCFTANAFGLYDSIGNVWEWTSSAYQGAHDDHMGDYQALRKQHHSSANYVIKGGSFLCADNYCTRFRNSSRHPQEFDLATTHVGFRTVKRIAES